MFKKRWLLTGTASLEADQAALLADQIDSHSQGHWTKMKILVGNILCARETENKKKETYTRVTLLSLLQVTWNHVQGVTRVASQLWSTLLGSAKLFFSALKASPAVLTKRKNQKNTFQTFSIN